MSAWLGCKLLALCNLPSAPKITLTCQHLLLQQPASTIQQPVSLLLLLQQPASLLLLLQQPVSPLLLLQQPASTITETCFPTSPNTATCLSASTITATCFPATTITATCFPASTIEATSLPASPITATCFSAYTLTATCYIPPPSSIYSLYIICLSFFAWFVACISSLCCLPIYVCLHSGKYNLIGNLTVEGIKNLW